MRIGRIWIVVVGLAGVLCGCSESASSEPAGERGSGPLSLAETQQMLTRELTVAQVKHRLGKPLAESEQSWGNLMYPLPDRKFLVFSFKGPFVTGARYDQTEISGVSPTVHRLLVRDETAGSKGAWHLEMDGRKFADLAELQKYLRSLPGKALVEYQSSDVHFGESDPLRTQRELEGLRRVCKEADLILLYYPGG